MNERTESAYLAKARHNLKNPVNAILGYSEMLIEDSEDEKLTDLISDLKKLHNAGNEVLKAIDNNFDEKNLSKVGKSITDIARDTEISIRTPLNTIIGYSELIIEDNHNIILDNFNSDMEKIIESGKRIEEELKLIIQFKDHLDKGIKLKSFNDDRDYSMVEDVLDSIKPLASEDKDAIKTGLILAVDDNLNNTDLLSKRLTRLGNKVITANDGKEALIILKDKGNDIDLMLLDIVMPEMNGFEVLKYIKGSNDYNKIPVIMISSMDDKDSIYRCIEMGADDYVTKPFDKEILNARISSSIERKQLRDKEKILMEELQEERDRSEHLLLNILPKNIAQRLKSGETDIANKHEDVSIIFCDIINFTPQAQRLTPNNLVKILNTIFKKFDDLSNKHNIEKIKTIGDSYFAVGGLNTDKYQAAKNIIELGKDFIKGINEIDKNTNEMDLNIRIGVHTGPIVAGVIGKNKFAYDLWGASVNMANRLESTCPPGRIQISEYTKLLLGDNFNYQLKEKTNIKGIGIINTYLVK